MSAGDSVNQVDSALITLAMVVEQLAQETLGEGHEKYSELKRALDSVKMNVLNGE